MLNLIHLIKLIGLLNKYELYNNSELFMVIDLVHTLNEEYQIGIKKYYQL